MDDLKVQTPGARFCHFPKRDDYGSAFFTGLLSEVKVYDPNKKNPWSWKKIPGHERNEALDCRNYALAAFKSLPNNLDAIDRRLKARRAGGGFAIARPAPRRTVKKKQSSGIDRYYDSW